VDFCTSNFGEIQDFDGESLLMVNFFGGIQAFDSKC
jgi:hypothetical protein